ncbi:MAG TPA: HAD family hydrolase [Pyrinomonadaceae bacterium]|jgi:phosphoglycolate phosphatase
MSPPSISNVLFDLDGTLTDPQEGITRCLEYSLQRLGAACPPRRELHVHIGPPIRSALSLMLGTTDEALVEQALRFYRERFSVEGLLENEVYDGVLEMLAALRAAKMRLYVATSKPKVFTDRILAHFRLTPYFDAVYGSELDGRLDNKVELIGHVLDSERLVAGQTLMVGDRLYDIIGARQNGCRSLGVTYGYGSEEELRAAGADLICHSPRSIPATLEGSGQEPGKKEAGR